MWPLSWVSGLPEHTVRSLQPEYDFIIVGGGTAGCVLARRLAEDGESTVLLVERGDAADSWLHRTPLLSHHHTSDGKHSTVIPSRAAPNSELQGRSFPLICGLGLGGSTRINGGQYTCGVPAQYNMWSQAGRQGWSYTDLKPYFDKSESWTGPVPKEYHGLHGPLSVRSFEGYFYGSSERAAEAIKRLGFLDIFDMHSPLEPSIGFNKMQFILGSDGTRQSAHRAYLPRDFTQSHRGNLHICTKTMATRVGTEKTADGDLRARSLELQNTDNGNTRTISARREIILTCGTLHTPQLLLLSGIGPQDHLQDLGIDLVKHLPGVGEHVQDHMLLTTSYNCPMADSLWSMARQPLTLLKQVYNYLRYGTGWFIGTFVEVEIFAKSSLIQADGKPLSLSDEFLDSYNPSNLPDFGVMVTPISDPNEPGANKSKGFLGLIAALLLSKSYGTIRLASTDPQAHPVCDMNYLSSPDDWVALRAALRVTVAVANEMRAEGYPLDDILVPGGSSDEALDDIIRRRVETMYHYSSSCRMAPEDDTYPGVVDDELRVHGFSNLRIADASIFPDVPAAHPQALIYAVAEKCADMMRRNVLMVA